MGGRLKVRRVGVNEVGLHAYRNPDLILNLNHGVTAR